jgi:hypothetical protein
VQRIRCDQRREGASFTFTSLLDIAIKPGLSQAIVHPCPKSPSAAQGPNRAQNMLLLEPSALASRISPARLRGCLRQHFRFPCRGLTGAYRGSQR